VGSRLFGLLVEREEGERDVTNAELAKLT